ncbi:MAG: tripartite tricarboxylate transporter substrate binding protein [Acetobacteraceae bacterium]|nr:tripartite tricarboxylate transporter substrate binding protein [Acetobacteraceae bacterium]
MLGRRRLLVATSCWPLLAAPAIAQGRWPARPVRIIVPAPPGGGTDTLARLFAQHFQGVFGQPFVVENRAGGGGVIGSEAAARAAADGYTLIVNFSGPITILPHLQPVPYDPLRSFTPIYLPAVTPLLLVVPASSAIRTLSDALQAARGRQGGLNLCNIGVGSPSHLVAEMFVRAFGVPMTGVPHRGSAPALHDTVAGHCDLLFDSATSSLALVQEGKLRAIATTGAQRMESLPEVPTMREMGAPAIEAGTWSALFAPAGMADEIVSALAEAAAALMRSEAQQARLRQLGSQFVDLRGDALVQFIAAESARWREVIRTADIRL